MTLRQWYARLRAAWRGHRPDTDLDAEIAFHLDEEADERVAAGLAPVEARSAARRDFGSVALVRETTREVWRWGAIERFAQDVRYGVRALKAAPVVAIVAILSLALGIGANTAIFSVLDSLLLRSLPVRDPQQLVLLQGGGAVPRTQWTNPLWEEIRARPSLFAGAFATSSTRFDLALGGESDIVAGLYASGGMFDVLGVPAMLGRTFTNADDRRGGGPDGPVAVIGYGFWQRRFGGAADVIGRSITVDRVPFTIVGVTPPGFFGIDVGRAFDVAIPFGAEPLVRGRESMLDGRSSWWLRIMIRLKPDQSRASADAMLAAVYPEIHAATLPQGWATSRYLPGGFSLAAAANGGSYLRQQYQRPLTTIMIVAGLVLLIACANLANLLLARAAARRPEMSLRLALGAPRMRIARQLLTESVVLSSAGALLGLLFARVTSDLLVRQISTGPVPVVLSLSLNWRVLAFAAAAAIATAVLFGTAPALRGMSAQPNDALKAQGRTASHDGRSAAFGQALVVIQVALSLVLVVGAGLFVRTFSALAAVPLGFDAAPVLIANVTLPAAQVAPEQRKAVFDRLLEAAARVPGVASAALSEMTPVGNIETNNYVELPDGPPIPRDAPLTYFNYLGPQWFETYGTPLLAGRDFTSADAPGAPLVAIVNETFARTFLGGRNPLGTRVRLAPDAGRPPAPDWHIVGYVKDAVYGSPRDSIPPTLYLPTAQREEGQPSEMSVSVRAADGSPVRLVKPLAAALKQAYGDAAITFRPLADQVGAALTQERLVAALSTFFGGLALLLAGVGLYGVTSYAVSRRRTEIGIRLALGSSPGGVIALVLRRVLLLVAVGTIVGAGVSLWASTFVSTLLFGLEPRDSLTLIAAIVVLAAVGTMAGGLPALRASRIDPARVLRDG